MEKGTVFSHGPHDAGLWTKLLEKAREGTTITRHYFVVDIVESSSHNAKFSTLCLPAEFWEEHHTQLTENVTLEGPDGQKWPVMLGLSWESKPCLLQGWREFAADFKLVVQDQIVFFLWEDSYFLIQVFDAHRNIKRRVDERNNDAKKKVDAESVELTNTHAPGGDEEENLKESKLLGRSSAPDPASAMISSDAEEELLRLKRSRKLIRKSTESRQGDELYTGSCERLEGLFKLAQSMKETAARQTGSPESREGLYKLAQSMEETAARRGSITAEGKPEPETSPVTASPKPKLATTVAEDKKPLQTRSQKLSTEDYALPSPSEFLTGTASPSGFLCTKTPVLGPVLIDR